MLSVLFSAFTWLLRFTVVKATAAGAIFGVVAILVPFVVGKIAPFISTTSLSQAFSSLSPSVWFFLDLFRLDYGLPLMISAAVARFLIRRLPLIG